MIIRYKGIYHENIKDAPFIGALICAIDCNIGCIGCCNQHLKKFPILKNNVKDVLDEVLSDKFNKGIILGGLEWTMQADEMMCLVGNAIYHDMKIMIYTGLDEKKFQKRFPEIFYLTDIYIKFGKYDKNLLCNDNIQHGIKLASSNQNIFYRGGCLND